MSQAGPLAVVIDDDPLVAEAMGLTVKDWGAEVVIAISLERALHAIGDRGGAINWIITDFDLGGGADGFEAVQRLKALSPGARALVLSGGSRDFAAKAAKLGLDALQKPASAAQIRTWLASA